MNQATSNPAPDVRLPAPDKARSGRLSRTVAAAPVRLYRRFVSPMIAPRCRYHPTCSTYALEAIRTYGPLRGAVLSLWRLLRCNPFSDGGFDPVEDQRLFKRAATGGGACGCGTTDFLSDRAPVRKDIAA